MRRIREVLRLKHELRRSPREIARSLGIANSTVSDYARRASAAGLSWPLPEGLDDAALEAALFPPPPSRVCRPEPDWDRVHRELQRQKGVTLELLWLEYRWRSGLCGGRVGLSCWGVTGRHIGATQSHSVRVRSGTPVVACRPSTGDWGPGWAASQSAMALAFKDLLRVYGGERLEAACHRALRIGTLTYRSVTSILATGRDQAAAEQYELSLRGRPANIRGPEYYAPTPRNGKES